ncbi:zinc finger protein 114 isoform X2 [Carlito syrichta]|nr:zinc finger protein 114 isoform X2 [Carlito syrichta]
MTQHETKDTTPQPDVLAKRTFLEASRVCLTSSHSQPSPIREGWKCHKIEKPHKQTEHNLKQMAIAPEEDESSVKVCEYHEIGDSSEPVLSQGDSKRIYIPNCDSNILKYNPVLNSSQKIYKNNGCDRVLEQNIPLVPCGRTQTELKSNTRTSHQNSLHHIHNKMDTGANIHEWNPFGEDLSLRAHRTHVREKMGDSTHCENIFRNSSNHLAQMQSSYTAGTNNENLQNRKMSAHIPDSCSLRSTSNGEKPHKCYECGKGFIYQSFLMRHMAIHTEEKPYECKKCGKSFKYFLHLNKHLRMHIVKTCKECGKALSRSSLRAHVRIHTGEKPYKCEKCGKAFIRSSGLKSHLKTHSRKKPCE